MAATEVMEVMDGWARGTGNTGSMVIAGTRCRAVTRCTVNHGCNEAVE